MENNITQEFLDKADAANSVEELISFAKENEIDISEEEAKMLFDKIHAESGELSDDELEDVSGGLRSRGKLIVTAFKKIGTCWKCKKCGGGINNKLDTHRCPNDNLTTPNCLNCANCTYERALWLCNVK